MLDLLRGPRAALRTFALAAAVGLCVAIGVVFLCVAMLLVALDRYGPIAACLGAAIVFFIVAAALAVARAVATRRRRREVRQTTAAASLAALSDPRAILVGLQIAQTIGLKRLLPLLAMAGAAFAVANARPEVAKRRREPRRHRRPDTSAPND